jgi:hypothetical protein
MHVLLAAAVIAASVAHGDERQLLGIRICRGEHAFRRAGSVDMDDDAATSASLRSNVLTLIRSTTEMGTYDAAGRGMDPYWDESFGSIGSVRLG